MDVDIPEPNPALAEVLIGERMRGIVEERANTAMMLAQAQVAKRTGTLARSAHAGTEVGGVRNDRWIGTMTLGSAEAYYAASHEFGRHAEVEGPARPGEEDKPVTTGGHHAAHDLNVVLEQLDSL